MSTWRTLRAGDTIIRRDVAVDPPPFVTESWIAAAFARPAERASAMVELLAVSDLYIAEIEAADVIVLGTPMYNYGMPAPLKAWIDQVVRINRTFSFDLRRGDWPLEPILSGRQLVLLTSCGEFDFAPGGIRDGMDHLGPHVRTCARYLGVDRVHHIGIEYQEFADTRHERSVAAAHASIPAVMQQVIAALR